MKLEVIVTMGDVFVNGEFVSQLCWNADAVGYAVANYLKSKGLLVDDDENDSDIAMRESLGTNWY